MTDPILFAYALDGAGGGRPLSGEDIGENLKADNLAWVHLNATHASAETWLASELNYLDPFVASALTADETRPRMVSVGDGAVIILRGVNTNSGADAEDMVSTRLFIDASRIISLQRRDLKAIADIQAKLESGRGPKNAGHFLTQLVARLTDRLETILTELDERVDDAEEKLIAHETNGLRQDITNIRKKAILFRRHMAPQREAISQLLMADLPWISEPQKRELRESYNHIIRYIEDLDALRERAQIVKDELVNLVADRMNKNTYVLSVIAAIFLPLGFLTGLFGINIDGMPGVNSPAAFGIFCLFLMAIVIVQIIIFRKMKWF
jgi:zinc transporter